MASRRASTSGTLCPFPRRPPPLRRPVGPYPSPPGPPLPDSSSSYKNINKSKMCVSAHCLKESFHIGYAVSPPRVVARGLVRGRCSGTGGGVGWPRRSTNSTRRGVVERPQDPRHGGVGECSLGNSDCILRNAFRVVRITQSMWGTVEGVGPHFSDKCAPYTLHVGDCRRGGPSTV